MQTTHINLAYEIQIEPGEKLTLPQSLNDALSPGRWMLMIRPLVEPVSHTPIRTHQAFLNSYVPEDEGLYDDYPV